jgi:hypothetical protein
VVALGRAGARYLLLLTVSDISLTPNAIAGGGAEIQAAKEFVATANTTSADPDLCANSRHRFDIGRCQPSIDATGLYSNRIWLRK